MGNAVFLNIEKLSRDNIIRLMDYLGGVIYVIDGKVKWSNSSSVIFAPKNVNISGIGDDDSTND
jgi:FtsZ-interacting cell division protein YlmF